MIVIPAKLFSIAAEVAAAHGLTLEQLQSRASNASVLKIRREAAIALKIAGASNQEAGAVLKRDGSSVGTMVRGGKGKRRKNG